MPAGVVVDHLDAIARRVRNEDAPALRIEGGVIKLAARGAWYGDGSGYFQWHDDLTAFHALAVALKKIGEWGKENRPRNRPRAISSNIECCAELGRRPSSGESACPRFSQANPASASSQDPCQEPRKVNAGVRYRVQISSHQSRDPILRLSNKVMLSARVHKPTLPGGPGNLLSIVTKSSLSSKNTVRRSSLAAIPSVCHACPDTLTSIPPIISRLPAATR